MASRNGAMVAGTDGSDYKYRGTISQQYQISAIYKERMRGIIWLHVLLTTIFGFISIPDVFYKPKIYAWIIGPLVIPHAQLWELWWLASIFPTITAWHACKTSNIYDMKLFRLYINAMGIMPISLGSMIKLAQLDHAAAKTGSDNETMTWMGIPFKLIWFSFFASAYVIHGIELYTARTLISTWTPTKTKSTELKDMKRR